MKVPFMYPLSEKETHSEKKRARFRKRGDYLLCKERKRHLRRKRERQTETMTAKDALKSLRIEEQGGDTENRPKRNGAPEQPDQPQCSFFQPTASLPITSGLLWNRHVESGREIDARGPVQVRLRPSAMSRYLEIQHVRTYTSSKTLTRSLWKELFAAKFEHCTTSLFPGT